MKYILSLDQGTTSSRAILFDHEGKVVTSAQKEFTQIFPQPGWVEHNPNEIWSSQSGVAAEAIKGERHSTRDITAIGITNQWETTIIWDRKTGEPVYNAIVWQDRRTAGICTKMKADGLSRTFQKKTGLLIDPYFAGTKVKWILNNVDGVRTRAEKGELAFGTVDSWLVWQLTNGRVHVTDESNAARTLLYNIHTGEWDKDLSEILGVQWHRIRWTCPVLVHKSSGQPGMRWHERWKMSCPGVPDPSCSARRRRWRPHRRWPSYWRRNLVTILRGKRGRSPMAIFLSEPP